jgi:hypothetical protein
MATFFEDAKDTVGEAWGGLTGGLFGGSDSTTTTTTNEGSTGLLIFGSIAVVAIMVAVIFILGKNK